VSTPTSAPAPGWYPDPAGSDRRRWWDGRAWTDSFAEGGWAGGIEQPSLAPGARVDTPWIWALVLLPLLQLAIGLLANPVAQAQRSAEQSLQHPGVVGVGVGFQLGAQGISLLFWLATVALALLDWRRLRAIGVVRPFHWAFAFIPAPVYIIGRTVVLRRRVRQGMAPLWTWIAVTVVTIVVVGIEIAQVFTTVLPQVLSSANA
jgi:hypothetical protein